MSRALEWRSFASVVVVLSAEIALVRVTAGSVDAADASVSLLLGCLLASLCIGFSRLATSRGRGMLGRVALALASGLPILLIAMGIAVPVVARSLGPIAALAGTALAATGIVACVRRARRNLPPPSANAGLVVLLGASSLAWLASAQAFPALPMLASLACLGGVFAWLGARLQRAFAAPALAAALVALPPLAIFDPGARGDPALATAASGPDIVLLTVDTLRADVGREMESYRRIAEQGLRFEAAQAAAPWTLPSMATLLSGVEMARHGARRRSDGRFGGIDPGVSTVAERLAAAGYDTAAFVSPNPFVGEHFGFAAGFQRFVHAGRALRFALPRVTDDWGYGDAQPVLAAFATRLSWLDRPTIWDADALTRRALAFVDAERGRPLFLWVHYLDAHLPYRHLADSGIDAAERRRLEGLRGHAALVSDDHWGSEVGRATLLAAYRHEVARVDAAILDLLDGLGPPTARGRVVVLTSDHGEEFGEHGGLEHGHTLYQELLAIPLAISGLATQRSGLGVDTPVGLADVAATLVARGGARREGLPGRDLGRSLVSQPVMSGNLLYGDAEGETAIRDAQWKLVTGPSTLRLHDLARDPGEERDLSISEPETLSRLRARVPRPVHLARPAAEIPRGEGNALRALGYTVD